MTQYSTHKKNNDEWHSPPFYTGSGGYKLCLRVNVNRGVLGVRRYVFACVHLMRGEYDRRLVWPFRADITIQLVNHNNDQDHRETTVFFDDAAVASGASKRVTSGKRAILGRGSDIISQTDVESSKRYLINDCLTFRVTKRVVHSV